MQEINIYALLYSYQIGYENFDNVIQLLTTDKEEIYKILSQFDVTAAYKNEWNYCYAEIQQWRNGKQVNTEEIELA